MILYKNKNYYTIYELLDLIRTKGSELNVEWVKNYPKYDKVVLLDQVNRVLYAAKKQDKICFLEFKKNPNSSRKYLAFAVDDVIDYLKSKNNDYILQIHEKE